MNVEESADQSLFQSIGDRKQLEATKSQHPGRAEVPCPVPGNTHGLSVLRVLWQSSTEIRPVPSSWLLLHSHRHRGYLVHQTYSRVGNETRSQGPRDNRQDAPVAPQSLLGTLPLSIFLCLNKCALRTLDLIQIGHLLLRGEIRSPEVINAIHQWPWVSMVPSKCFGPFSPATSIVGPTMGM